jgi:hypothetical protein
MPLRLSNTLDLTTPRTTLSAAELEAELAAARRREAQAAEQAAEQARQAAARVREAERQARAQLDALEAELAAMVETADQARPPADLRMRARAFLYGSPDAAGSEILVDLARRDPECGRLHDLHRTAGRLMQQLAEAGATDAYDRADTAECAAWSALATRIRWLAGER